MRDRGMLLVPSIFAWLKMYAVIDSPWQPNLMYPPRGTANPWLPGPEEPGEALSAVVGPGRASVLEGLVIPRTTTEIARQSGSSPGTISEHLSRLRKAGLVEPYRRGRSVFYRLTPTGESLLGLFEEAE